MELPTISTAILEYVDSTRRTSHNRVYRERLYTKLMSFYQPMIDSRISDVTPSILRKLFTGSEVQTVHGLDERLLYLDRITPKIAQNMLRMHQNFWDWLVIKYKLVQPMVMANDENLRVTCPPKTDPE